MPALETPEGRLLQAVRRLQDKHLLQAVDDAVSLRLPGAGLLLWRRGAISRHAADLQDDSPAAQHAAILRARPDAGAVARLSPRWSLLQARSGGTLPVCFDEQARHLGRPWRRSLPLEANLAGGGNAGMVEGCLLVLGVTPDRTVFNAELFEKCAMAAALAQAAGTVHMLPWWVRLIAGRRLARDQAAAAARHRDGLWAEELAAY